MKFEVGLLSLVFAPQRLLEKLLVHETGVSD
jgi:hypothetical protein